MPPKWDLDLADDSDDDCPCIDMTGPQPVLITKGSTTSALTTKPLTAAIPRRSSAPTMTSKPAQPPLHAPPTMPASAAAVRTTPIGCRVRVDLTQPTTFSARATPRSALDFVMRPTMSAAHVAAAAPMGLRAEMDFLTQPMMSNASAAAAAAAYSQALAAHLASSAFISSSGVQLREVSSSYLNVQQQSSGEPAAAEFKPQSEDISDLRAADLTDYMGTVTPESLGEFLECIAIDAPEERDKIVQELVRKNGPCGTPKKMQARGIKLYEYQLEGLAWMIRMEREKFKGGILADDMGLGKTIQTIALISENPPPPEQRIKGTLIVCPVGLMRQWKNEIEEKADGLRVLIYHGPNRTQSKFELRKYDVVMTTYMVIAMERPTEGGHIGVDGQLVESQKAGPIFRARWHRVILDEAQYIKNKTAKMSLGAEQLGNVSETRFCLSGTPLQNHIDDIYSLFRFLKTPMVEEYDIFRESIGRKINSKHEHLQRIGYARLQAILKTCLLRRRKTDKRKDGRPLVELPPREVVLDKCTFSEHEKNFYEALEGHARLRFNKLDKAGTATVQMSVILVMILRLRQAADHPHLISEMKDLYDSEDKIGFLDRMMKGVEREKEPKKNGKQRKLKTKEDEGDACDSESERQRKKARAEGGGDADDDEEGDEEEGDDLDGFIVNDDEEDDSFDDEAKKEEKQKKKRKRAEGKRLGAGRAGPSKGGRIQRKKKKTSISDELLRAKDLMKEADYRRLLDGASDGDGGGLLSEDCSICLDCMTDAVATKCGHLFCKECLVGFLEHPGAAVLVKDKEILSRACPNCNQIISQNEIIDAKCFLPDMDDEESDEPEPEPEEVDEDIGSTQQQISGKPNGSQPFKPPTMKGGGVWSLKVTRVPKARRIVMSEDEEEDDEAAPQRGKKKKKKQSLAAQAEEKEISPEERIAKLIQAVSGLHPDGDLEKFISSSKTSSHAVDRLVALLEEIREEDEDIKTIIFSQWTGFDGKMTAMARNDAVENFTRKDRIKVMLVSLKAGNVGLNLTRASRAILMDCWWNPQVEEQAIDRIHRIGQKRPVKVYRMIIENTVEEKIIALQEKKRAMAAGALGEGNFQLKKLTLNDLRFLFGAKPNLDP
ncbi:hypothetical protein HK101_001498 [Irineochytrium annulatum]|nr:hypothetical protein HK101_001498 [Irineochytrium annulatum]